MITDTIQYKTGYKYVLAQNYVFQTNFWPTAGQVQNIDNVVVLHPDGRLCLNKGYAWDGASGPVIDRKAVMRASLVHDALYQLMRNGKMGNDEATRQAADEAFKELCICDGVPRWLAHVYYLALRQFGRPAATRRREIHLAPRGK